MINNKRILLLNGSPRKKKTSYSFARTIKTLAEKKGCTTEIVHIIDYFDDKKSIESLKDKILESNIIGMVSPLYVDTLPYPVIQVFERVYGYLEGKTYEKDFFAIGQCGFPNPTLCQPLLETCRCFAESLEMNWLGGLGYGGGAIIDGQLLENLGKKGKKISHAFDIAIDDIIKGKNISREVQELLTVKIPKILYRPLAIYLNHRSRKEAQKYGNNDVRKKPEKYTVN